MPAITPYYIEFVFAGLHVCMLVCYMCATMCGFRQELAECCGYPGPFDVCCTTRNIEISTVQDHR